MWWCSNYVNTARTLFNHYGHSAPILGIDVDFVYNVSVISRSRTIDSVKFRSFLNIVYRDYIRHCNCYYMATSIHKLLIHDADANNYLY